MMGEESMKRRARFRAASILSTGEGMREITQEGLFETGLAEVLSDIGDAGLGQMARTRGIVEGFEQPAGEIGRLETRQPPRLAVQGKLFGPATARRYDGGAADHGFGAGDRKTLLPGGDREHIEAAIESR